MTKQRKLILFLSLIVLFLLTAPAAIFYSQGYRIDFEKRAITRTGGLYFKTQPGSVQIYLNDTLVKKTGFWSGGIFGGGALIENLLPKNYQVKVQKEGYFSWKKNLQVHERLVTEAKNIYLVLKNPELEILQNNIEDFFFSPDQKNIVLQKNTENGWILNLNETLLSQEKDLGKGAQLSDMQWSDDSKRILLTFTSPDKTYFIFDLERETLVSLDFLGTGIEEISFDLRDREKIFFQKNLNVFSVNYLTKNISTLILNKVLTYQISNNRLFWLNQDGMFFQSDLSGERMIDYNAEPFELLQNEEYEIVVLGEYVAFLKGKDFYLFWPEKESFEKIAENVREIKISSDFRKIAYITDHEIWILFLKEIDEQPQKKQGEKLFLTRFSERIEEVFWWTSHYLVFQVADTIKITEIDDRDEINMYDIIQFPVPQIFWNGREKSLYILSEGKLYSSEKLY